MNFGNEYDNNVHFGDVKFICGPHLVIIDISKIRLSNESYARKMNIITIIIFVSLLRHNAMRCKKPGSTVHLYRIYVRK